MKHTALLIIALGLAGCDSAPDYVAIANLHCAAKFPKGSAERIACSYGVMYAVHAKNGKEPPTW